MEIENDFASLDGNKKTIYDVIGIGFGPANIAMAIALDEMAPDLKCMFVDKKKNMGWHPGMMFNDATMQVSFLKDLVTQRNPISEYSFVNYLHSVGRLNDFINLQTFCPTRREFMEYLQWCTNKLPYPVFFGKKVQSISMYAKAKSPSDKDIFQLTIDDGGVIKMFYTRSIVYSGGLSPNMPNGVLESERIFHGYHLLDKLNQGQQENLGRVLVVGGGQSAAEIVKYLYDNYPQTEINFLTSVFGFRPADDSPFVNQVFDPEAVDLFFEAPKKTQSEILCLHRGTNYNVVDVDLIKSIYQLWYNEKVCGYNRLNPLRMCRLEKAVPVNNKIFCDIYDGLASAQVQEYFDYVICATGFLPRSPLPLFDKALTDLIDMDEGKKLEWDRNYKICSKTNQNLSIYCVNDCEKTHGLSSTLISNMAVKSGEIVSSITHYLNESDIFCVDNIAESVL